jgi:Frog skin active peptide family signal and propeptide
MCNMPGSIILLPLLIYSCIALFGLCEEEKEEEAEEEEKKKKKGEEGYHSESA